jgi:hypothetical protein
MNGAHGEHFTADRAQAMTFGNLHRELAEIVTAADLISRLHSTDQRSDAVIE